MNLLQAVFKTAPIHKKKTKVELLLELSERLSQPQKKQPEQDLKMRLEHDAEDFCRRADAFLHHSLWEKFFPEDVRKNV